MSQLQRVVFANPCPDWDDDEPDAEACAAQARAQLAAARYVQARGYAPPGVIAPVDIADGVRHALALRRQQSAAAGAADESTVVWALRRHGTHVDSESHVVLAEPDPDTGLIRWVTFWTRRPLGATTPANPTEPSPSRYTLVCCAAVPHWCGASINTPARPYVPRPARAELRARLDCYGEPMRPAHARSARA